ncbi:hypothetical protein SteCoe_770 [Stentor coeruleus]|uniref:DUSP domain-containing protein n=1 Tax=Stentor coeruleus TaxID=5963 RepID=A0A1R2D378_9CILI|nr:hypothetical protein SteCoe_770 [Stentor coeruleus]
MECPICFYNWNAETTLPVILICGHTLCMQCCKGFYSISKVKCPTCSVETIFSLKKSSNESDGDFAIRCIDSLTKNFTLLSLVPARNNSKSRLREFKYGMRCKEHNLLIHSYVAKPFSMLCDNCLEEISETKLTVIPFPECLEFCRENLENIRKSVEQLKENKFILDVPQEETIRASFDEHFESIEKKIKDAQKIAIDCIQGKIDEFMKNNKQQHKRFKDTLAKIRINEQKIGYISKLSISGLLKEKQYLDNLIIASRESLPSSSIPSFILNASFKSDTVSVFKDFVKSSLNIQLKKQTFKEKWYCRRCNKSYFEGRIQCECGCFRPLESYQNLLSNPSNVSLSEIAELNQRRDIEKDLINKLDACEEINCWYLINADWVYNWKSFVFNKPSRPGMNIGEVGVYPPGPINNSALLKENGELRPKLKPAVHYRAVNKKVWEAYVLIYSGGPAIIRKTLNIYE